jgi:hypothetical protein
MRINYFTTKTVEIMLWFVVYFMCFNIHGKGKAIPLQAWTGPEGYRRLRLPDFKTTDTRMW